MLFYSEEKELVVKELSTDIVKGLSEAQAAEKRSRFGDNKLQEKKKKSNLQRFADQFKDVMILILIAAAAISFTIACIEGNPREFFERS